MAFKGKTFVGGTQLKTTGAKTEEVKKATAGAAAGAGTNSAAKAATTPANADDEEDTVLLPGEKDVQPVGMFPSTVTIYLLLLKA